MGNKGSFAGSNYQNESDGWGDVWSQEKRANGEHRTHRKKFKKSDKSETNSQGAALGKGAVKSKADNNGGMVHAKGTNGSKGTTGHKGHSNTISDEFSFGF